MCIVIVIFYALLVLFSDIQQSSYQWANINFLYVPLILGVHLVVIFMRGIRQKLFLDSLGIRISFKNNIVLHMAGLSMIMTPGGSGEVIKSHFLEKNYEQPYTKTIPIVLAEKYHDLLAVISIMLVMLLFRNSLESQIVVGVMSILLGGIFLIVKKHGIFKTTVSKISKIWILNKLFTNVDSTHNILYTLSQNKTFLLGWMIGIVIWSLDAFTIYLSFHVFGLDYSFIDSTLLMYTAIIAGAISFLPGGVGVTELSMVGLLVKSGITLSVASSLTLFIRLTTLWFSTIIGIIVLKFVMIKKK